MSYTELADSTAMLKTALRLLKADADDDIETFKKELKQQIEENEQEMDAYDNWIDQKEMEAKYNVDIIVTVYDNDINVHHHNNNAEMEFMFGVSPENKDEWKVINDFIHKFDDGLDVEPFNIEMEIN